MNRVPWRPAKALLPLLAVLTPVFGAESQQVRGTIVDSAARTPIVGAVVETLDSAGLTLARGLTNEFGAYTIGLSSYARRLRVVRMGYRPRAVDIGSLSGVERHVDLAMLVVPKFLEAVTSTSPPNCPHRADSQRAFALLEQARAGLQATVVARQVNQPAIKIIRFERHSDGAGERILRQSVHLDSSDAVATSFGAVYDASRFARDGFITDSSGTSLYYGPDADVMLAPSFAASYCFRIREGRNRAEIGLGFTPARTLRARTDIEGTLWIDTVARVVSQIAFEYVGVPRTVQIKPGGEINFRAMPNGSVIIDRWSFRMMDVSEDTASGSSGAKVVKTFRRQREAGGEVAWARWPDGYTYRASLATVRLKVVNKFGEPVSRAVIRLTNTDYVHGVDTAGMVQFDDVFPGPYDVELEDSALVNQKIVIKSATHFIADRGKLVTRTVESPPVYAFFKQACLNSTTGRWVEYRAFEKKDRPVAVSWKLGEDLNTRLETIRAVGVTQRDGIFGYCRDLDERATLHVQLTRVSDPTKTVIVELPATKYSIAIPVVMPFRALAGR